MPTDAGVVVATAELRRKKLWMTHAAAWLF